MTKPASESEKTTALAFVLLHGNPPKSVKYRDRMFTFRNQVAKQYKHKLEAYLAEEFVECYGSARLCVMARNRCLRYIMGVGNDEQRDAD